MKKIYLFVLTLLLMIPFSVFATEYPRVLTLAAVSNNLKIVYSGITEDESYAVMCKLYDENEEEIDMLSSAVKNKTFKGTFSVTNPGDYVVACANYEGGEIKKANVTVDLPNPNTYDSGIKTSIVLLIISLVGILGVLIVLLSKKHKKN